VSIKITETGAALGARIEGGDLTNALDDATFAAVRNAFYKYEVVYFRGSELSDEDHIRFSERFGELRKLKLDQLHAKHPEIFIVSNIVEDGKHIGAYDAGLFWHTDRAYLKNPHAVSALRALEVPVQEGRVLGDTVFASMSAGYDALSESMKKRLEGLQALHSIIHRHQKTVQSGRKKEYNAAVKADPEAVHPVVRVHPITKRKCLYVSEGYTVKIMLAGRREPGSDCRTEEPYRQTRVSLPAQLAQARPRHVGRLFDTAQGDIRLCAPAAQAHASHDRRQRLMTARTRRHHEKTFRAVAERPDDRSNARPAFSTCSRGVIRDEKIPPQD
jgi:taurine dioxygenase